MENDNNENNEAYQRALWQDRYGDMVPEKIIDTKIGPDGKRYYKVQWAETTMEAGKNFLEAELLIKKYWDPVEKKLKFPSRERENEVDDDEAASSSTQCDDDGEKSNETSENEQYEKSKGNYSGTSSTDPINDEKDSKAEKSNIRKSSCVENSDSVTHLEESSKIKDVEVEENHLKRKRSESDDTPEVTFNTNGVTDVEVATKKAKDENGE